MLQVGQTRDIAEVADIDALNVEGFFERGRVYRNNDQAIEKVDELGDLHLPEKLVSDVEVDGIRVILVVFLGLRRPGLGPALLVVFLGVARELLGVGPETLFVGADELGPQHPVPVKVVHVAVQRVDVVREDLRRPQDVMLRVLVIL